MNKERGLLKEIMCYFAAGEVAVSNASLGDLAETLYEIQELLAQPEQEPVAWKDNNYGNLHHVDWGDSIPLYTSPQKQKPLSAKQAEDLWETSNFKTVVPYYIFDEICVAIEQYRKIGGDND